MSDISDHLPTLTFLNNKITKKSNESIVKRNLSKFNIDHFLNELEHLTCRLNHNKEINMNVMCEVFVTCYELLIDKHAPKETLTKKENKYGTKLWMNNKIKNQIRKKDKLFKEWHQTRDEKSYIKYKKYRNKVTHSIKEKKHHYQSNLFKKSYNNPKSLWKNINYIINYKSKNSNKIHHLIDSSGDILSKPQDISNTFNNFFINVGKNLSKSIPNVNESHTNIHYPTTTNSIFIKQISPTEIYTLIMNLDHNKSTPSTNSSIKFLKMSARVICSFLSKNFNNCISQGLFPDCLKIAEVKPLFKSGCKDTASNYRPISLLPPLSKVFEKCLHSRLSNFFNSHNILYHNQFGFRSNSSTENAVLKICNEIYTSVNNKEIVCSIFLDFKKAFDTVNHQILLKKLPNYGVRGRVLKLLNSYLSNRKQYTLVNGTRSV